QRLPKNQNYAYRRRSAAWVLGEMGPVASNAVPALEHIRKSSVEPDVRVTAIIALAKIQPRNPVARSNLLAELHSKVQTSRYFAALELGAFHNPDPQLVTALIGALDDKDGEVRANAVWSVAQLGSVCHVAGPRLRELLNDPYRHIPVNAAYALVRVAPELAPEGVQAIQKLLERGSYLADSAVIPLALALGPSATNAIPWLEDCLFRRGRGLTEEVALVSLWRIRRQATPEMLARLPQLGSPAAIRALGELGPLAAAAEPRLRDLAASGNELQREAARTALRQIRAETPRK
ncbi:MAG TPA: HEAT repeat domain-containing protein, partial [Candidatus Limnocylindria bacterium]|nr:HEAT repeat domain-containing protein [Candidatus Limnocylindria bacterium]